MRSSLAQTNFYPDHDSNSLRQKLAERNSLSPEHVLVSAGSSEFLSLLCRTLLNPGTNAVTSQLSFIVYSIITKAEGAAVVETPLRDGGFDLEALAKAINADTRIVFLANPNNPTGTVVSADEVENFLARVPENVTVVLDEAYCDYADYFAKQRKVKYSRSLDYSRRTKCRSSEDVLESSRSRRCAGGLWIRASGDDQARGGPPDDVFGFSARTGRGVGGARRSRTSAECLGTQRSGCCVSDQGAGRTRLCGASYMGKLRLL